MPLSVLLSRCCLPRESPCGSSEPRSSRDLVRHANVGDQFTISISISGKIPPFTGVVVRKNNREVFLAVRMLLGREEREHLDNGADDQAERLEVMRLPVSKAGSGFHVMDRCSVTKVSTLDGVRLSVGDAVRMSFLSPWEKETFKFRFLGVLDGFAVVESNDRGRHKGYFMVAPDALEPTDEPTEEAS